jgi:D-alanine-D-alanine ligase
VVKPNSEGSTIGCTIVKKRGDLGKAIEEAFKYDSNILIEQFIAGIEITACLLENGDLEVLPLIEIEARDGFYDYIAKYTPGGSTHIIPARISQLATERARDYAIRSHRALQCSGMSRVDMLVVADQPYVLEVNTIPGMTQTSLFPEAAQAAGISFSTFLDVLINDALASHSS